MGTHNGQALLYLTNNHRFFLKFYDQPYVLGGTPDEAAQAVDLLFCSARRCT